MNVQNNRRLRNPKETIVPSHYYDSTFRIFLSNDTSISTDRDDFCQILLQVRQDRLDSFQYQV